MELPLSGSRVERRREVIFFVVASKMQWPKIKVHVRGDRSVSAPGSRKSQGMRGGGRRLCVAARLA